MPYGGRRGGIPISISCLLFTNKEIPDFCVIKVDGESLRFPDRYPLEKGHDGWWDYCFAQVPPGLPVHHYGFVFPIYNEMLIKVDSESDPGCYSRILKDISISKEYLRAYIRMTGEEPLYIRLHADHVITEADLEDIIDFNLDDYDFHEGKAPKEIMFEINKFYRFKVK